MVESAPPLVEPPWRVVVFTNIPGGRVYTLLDEVMRSLGHRIVGVVTTPGPPKRRSADYLDVVAAVPPPSSGRSATAIPSSDLPFIASRMNSMAVRFWLRVVWRSMTTMKSAR